MCNSFTFYKFNTMQVLRNGYCDEENNSSDCGFNGGDCTVDTELYF